MIMEFFGSPVRAHSIDFGNYKSEFGQSSLGNLESELFRDMKAMRAGIDVFDHGIDSVGIKLGRFDKKSMDHGLSIPSGGGEANGHGVSFL